jgi:hypothetical protein
MQKFWKNDDKKLEVMMKTMQKIPFKLDQAWWSYDFYKLVYQK